MRQRQEAGAQSSRLAALQGESYAAIDLPTGLGMECSGYKWRQNQSHVEVFIPLPPGTTSRQIDLTLTPSSISVTVQERPILRGALFHEIKAEESTWYIQDGVLEVVMLKRNRRGNYERGTTNADTFWRAVTTSAPENERLALDHAPTGYYWSHCEDDKPAARLPSGRRPTPRLLQEA
jgi:CS domain